MKTQKLQNLSVKDHFYSDLQKFIPFQQITHKKLHEYLFMNTASYSKFIRPLLYIIDLFVISSLADLCLYISIVDLVFIIAFWIILSIFLSFYKVYRFTKITAIVGLLSKQIIVLVLLIFSYLYITHASIHWTDVIHYFLSIFLVLNIWRIFLYEVFKKYRIITGSNYRNVIVIGANDLTGKLVSFFDTMPSYGYKFKGFFTDKGVADKLGSIEESFDYMASHAIDEVYCSVSELSDHQLKQFIEFCDIHMKNLKFLPDNKELFAKNLHLNYYDLIPVLSLRKIPLDDTLNSWVKRIFDVLIAVIVLVCLLSWLIPLMSIIIKLESRGPVFFRQNRPGIKEKGFYCYKFRSMQLNARSEDSASRNDARVTKVGKFIRRTSIDELPQFINVLLGDMSVVGPRPHLWKQNELYGTKISKYMVRHFVKPGITGLAQVKGYRGGIETKEDIINRTKYDIFYIENWSLLLDIYIMVQTVFNVFKGEENAY